MTDHPCKGMTKAQVAAFERVAINQQPACHQQMISELLLRGLIARGQDDMRRDALGVYAIPRFYVPLPVHAQWCQWCSEQPENVDHD